MHPSYFNPSLSAYLKLSLRRQVEGSCSGRLGYIIAVTADNLGSEGQPLDEDEEEEGGVPREDKGMRGRIAEDGQAVFRLRYQAIVYRPFRGEVVDGVVASVNKVSSQSASGQSNIADSLSIRTDGYLCRCRSSAVFRFNSCEPLLNSRHR